jgi:hypothetical protein
VLSKEEIKYTYQSIGKIKKSYFNEDGRLYKEGLLEMNGALPLREDITFVATGTKVLHEYTYDAAGALIQYKYYTDAMGKPYSETVEFGYKDGKLDSQRLFRNQIPLEERFYYYEDVSGLPESVLVKKTDGHDLVFYNFTYQYFP